MLALWSKIYFIRNSFWKFYDEMSEMYGERFQFWLIKIIDPKIMSFHAVQW